MEFVKRVKQRLAELEGDPEDYPENETSEHIECLKSEIFELKTKLNSMLKQCLKLRDRKIARNIFLRNKQSDLNENSDVVKKKIPGI